MKPTINALREGVKGQRAAPLAKQADAQLVSILGAEAPGMRITAEELYQPINNPQWRPSWQITQIAAPASNAYASICWKTKMFLGYAFRVTATCAYTRPLIVEMAAPLLGGS